MPNKIDTKDRYIISVDGKEETEFDDLFDANRYLAQVAQPKYVIQKVIRGVKVQVDFETGSIFVDGDEIDLEISVDDLRELRENRLRWVNFNRVHVTYGMGCGRVFESRSYVIGWQATNRNGSNIQRTVIVEGDGKWELKKKGY